MPPTPLTSRLAVPGLLLAALLALCGAAPPAARHANRLARESSPYLLQHAHNPVDWYPWGGEAFARAKKEGKLVFLSIGYSSCHWCHVMERESFSRDDVARILNRDFVCIKVDREERPDVDQVYMTALNATGNRGGWPLSMWLTADGRPVVGGTYWPREDREVDGERVRGFKTLLGVIQKFHAEKPRDLEEQADRLARATRISLAGEARATAVVPLERKLVAAAVGELHASFDKVHGGFGSPARDFQGTKFPMPPNLLLLQAEAGRTRSKELGEVVGVTLDHMARGGIYDHLGGGFARYSTERTWTVPHFEKMLYDNAQLLEVYARAHRADPQPFTRRVLRQTADFVARELTAPDGGFYSALDADSEGEEGRFYVWADKELDAVLTDKADNAFFRNAYGAGGMPNFEGRYHILRLPVPAGDSDSRLEPLRRRLFDARSRRPRPFLDTKVLTAWNGQMIAGLARAGEALGDKAVTARAVRAADFVLANLRDKDGRLLRTWGAVPGGRPAARGAGYLDDYAYLVHGLLTLHDVTGGRRWLVEARALTDKMIEFHADKERGAFFYTSSDHEKLFARTKDQYDGVQPSANSTAAYNLVRLWQKTGEESYGREAGRSFGALAGALRDNPGSLSALAEALALYLDEREARAGKK